jgi:hypothetical protein
MRVRTLLCAVVLGLAVGAAAGLAAPQGRATTRTPGDGCLVVQSGFGKVTVVLTRGVLFGRAQSGTVTIDDLVAGDGTPRVFGFSITRTRVADRTYQYSGANLRFRSTGAVRLTVSDATFIDLSVVGRGAATLSSGTFDVPFNLFSVDSASFCEEGFQQMPVKPTRFVLASPDIG